MSAVSCNCDGTAITRISSRMAEGTARTSRGGGVRQDRRIVDTSPARVADRNLVKVKVSLALRSLHGRQSRDPPSPSPSPPSVSTEKVDSWESFPTETARECGRETD